MDLEENGAEVFDPQLQAFDQIAQETKEGCPVSKALKGNVEIQLDARLV